MLPTLGRIVHYRGKQGVQAMRAAIVVVDWDSWVRGGDIPDLDDEGHVHLWVFSPNDQGGFMEYNVKQANPDVLHADGKINPGTWTWPARVS